MRPWLLGAAVLLAGTAIVAAGTPARLPGIAMGSAVLLHAERALALVAVVVAALSVVLCRDLRCAEQTRDRGRRGRRPARNIRIIGTAGHWAPR
jgi:membrane protein implicated in regulation of membrane protease activity